MKKIFITLILTIFCIGIYNISAFADENEHKWYIVADDYVRYGHIIVNADSGVNVVMIMLDNGTVQKFIPLIYSTMSSKNVSLWYGGDHTEGNNIEQAKALDDYYDYTYNLSCVELSDNWNPDILYYLYNVWTPTIMESGAYNIEDFYTSSPKYYYYEEGADLSSQDVYVNALSKLFNNELKDFTYSDGSFSTISSYALEPPLNIQVNNYQPKKVTVSWEQSEDINTTGWYTEFYFQQQGTVKKTIFSTKKKFDTDFLYYDKVLTYYKKFTFNSLALETTDEFLIDFINNNGHSPQITEIEKTNIMMRNVFDDGNGNISYSNYVYLFQDDNYEYIANEIDGETIDKNGISSSNIDSSVITDSEFYDNANIDNIGNSSITSGNAINIMRSLLNDIKDFPKFVYEFFSFLPEEIYVAISAFLLLLIPIALIKIVI